MAIADVAPTPASEVIDSSVQAAKRLIRHQMNEFEDLRDATALRVRKAPLTSVGIALGTGVLLGLAVGYLSAACPRKDAKKA